MSCNQTIRSYCFMHQQLMGVGEKRNAGKKWEVEREEKRFIGTSMKGK